MGNATILSVAAAYILFLFGLAYVIDRRVAGGRQIRLGPWTYGLSLAVYCTAWTFYGSVGEAAVRGIDFLPIYLGPILVFTLGIPVVRKMVAVGKAQHITSIADFIAARHGKSHALAGFVTLIAVIGIMPYISLQLKAISAALDILHHYPALQMPSAATAVPAYADSALYVTLAMFLFCVVFGTRRVDATEQHRGLIAAIALESMVKLAAFLAIGLFVIFVQFDGPGALFAAARQRPELASLIDPGPALARAEWWAATVLAMAAVIGLPRQFQVTVVENTDARHLRTAAWVFPLYLMAMAAFVLPIALAGRLAFTGGAVPGGEVYFDTYVLALPIAGGQALLALLVFIGGLSAATAMVLAETIALSTMVSNDLVIPLLLRAFLAGGKAIDPGRWVKWIRRASIALVLLLAYSYVRLIGNSYTLVGLGLLSFGAAAQFVPVLLGGLYWRGASRAGAFAGLAAGFVVWGYTLLLPTFVRAGLLPSDLLTLGPFGIAALRPEALFGLTGLTPLLHGALWCTAANIAGYVGLSVLAPPSTTERRSAEAFIDGPRHPPADANRPSWRTSTTIGELTAQIAHFVDPDRVERACRDYAQDQNAPLDAAARVDAGFAEAMERLLAGAIGTASARVVVAAELKERDMGVDEVMTMLDNASHAIGASREMLRDAIETISQGIAMVDADGRLLVWNRRFVELLDLPHDHVFVGASLESMPPLASPNRADDTIEVVRRPLPGGGFVSTYTDITGRKRQERALLQAYDELEIRVEERTRELSRSEERFRDIAESASDWFWETGPSLQVSYISNRFLEITGLSGSDVDGRMFWEIRSSPDSAAAEAVPWEDLIEAMRAHRPIRGFEYAVACADDRTHHIRLTGKPRFGDDGAFLGYRGTGADITELVATQADLLRSEKLAALGGLVAGVAHEINTPLGVGVTAASFLDERTRAFAQLFADDDVSREDLEAFITAARDTSASLSTNLRRAADLVRSFKNVAADQSNEQRRRFNLRAYIDEVLVSLQPALRRTRHRIDVDAAHDIEIVSDPGVVSQILTNLIMNSLIHGFEDRDEGHIRIAATHAAGQIVLDYADDGKGMNPEQARRIFEPFFTTRRGQGGTGLGMNIVYNLVTQTLGGRLECRTAPGQGVSFHIIIPVNQGPENQEGTDEPA